MVTNNLTLIIEAVLIEGFLYRLDRRLVVVAIDFKKDFDSEDRMELIRALMYCKCDSRLINVVLNLYVGGRTEMTYEKMGY